MAGYSTSNPPRLLTQGIATGPKQWAYASVDAASLVVASGYFTNGGSLGMKPGDFVFITDSDTSPYVTSGATVVTVSATTGAVDLSDAITLGGGGNGS